MHIGNYICKIASIEEMEQKWDYEISQHSEKRNWIVWKDQAIESSRTGLSIPYYGILDGTVICEATAVLNPGFEQACGIQRERLFLKTDDLPAGRPEEKGVHEGGCRRRAEGKTQPGNLPPLGIYGGFCHWDRDLSRWNSYSS